ncbi:MAG: HIRAN domain-containing protein [Acidimicrobiales bacterium]
MALFRRNLPGPSVAEWLALAPNVTQGVGSADIVALAGVQYTPGAAATLAELQRILPLDPVGHQRCRVALRREPDNPQDPNAVRVELGPQVLGHLVRADAVAVQAVLLEAETARVTMLGDAMLMGGREGHPLGMRIQVRPHLRNKRGQIPPPEPQTIPASSAPARTAKPL